MKKIIAPLLFAVSFLFFSCGNKEVLSPEKMEDLLVDIHLADGISMQNSAFKKNTNKLDLYATIYAKHNITKAEFDSSMVYYSENLGDLSEIYDAVYDRLVQLEVEVQAGKYAATTSWATKEVNARIAAADVKLLPFVQKEMWPKKREIKFSDQDFDNGVNLDIPIDTLLNRKMEMRFDAHSKGLKSATCQIELVYKDTETATKNVDIPVNEDKLFVYRWTTTGSPDMIKLKFTALKDTLDEVALSLNDCRIYDVSDEAHNINIFR